MTSNMQIIRGGLVQASGDSVLQQADILIRGDTILDIGPPGMAAPDDAITVAAEKRILIPGLVNAHTHSHYNFGKGFGDRWTLEIHLNSAPWILANRTIDDLYLSTLLGAIEMVRKGCTSCYDMVVQLPVPTIEGMSAIAKAYEVVGMRAVIAFAMADQTFWQTIPDLVSAIPAELRETVTRIAATPSETSIKACAQVIEQWPFPNDRIRPALGPTIPMLCSDEFLQRASDLARQHGIGLHTHLAESKVQAIVAKRRYGKTLVQHLEEVGFLGPDVTAAHAIWVNHDDIRRLGDNGVSIAHNPGSNLRLGNGIAPAWSIKKSGLTVGIGTDACSCSDHLNMFEAMRMAALSARAQTPDFEYWPTSADIFSMGTSEGATLLGFSKVGRLEPGYKADIVFLDRENLNYVPLNNFLTQLVFCENGSAVDGLMIGGRLVLERGRLTTINVEKVIKDVERAVDRLRQVNTSRRAELDAIGAIVGKFCVGLAQEPHDVHRYIRPPNN